MAVAAAIRSEEVDVDARLAEFGLSKPALIEVLRSAFAQHGNCTENDPAGARGYLVYKEGVRGLREQYRRHGWEIDRTGGLETIVDHNRKMRIAVISTDTGTANPAQVPQNRNRKGPSSERAALTNAQITLPGAELWPRVREDGSRVPAEDYATWHLCIFIEGDDLRAELSLLSEFTGGYFVDAFERIFLVGPDEWNPLMVSEPLLPEDAPGIEVEVRRKSH